MRRLTGSSGPDTFPRLAKGPSGEVTLAWQSGGKGNTDISLMVLRDGKWSAPVKLTEHPASDWEPSVSINSQGGDCGCLGRLSPCNYDIFLRRVAADGKPGPLEQATTSPDFEAHANIVSDGRDRLWLAWGNGGANWGKDHYGIDGINRSESGVYFQRQVQVHVLDCGRLAQPAFAMDQPMPPGNITPSWMALGLASAKETFTEYPALQLDGKGRVWALVRTRAVGRANPPPVSRTLHLPLLELSRNHVRRPGLDHAGLDSFSPTAHRTAPGFVADAKGDLWVATQTDGKSLSPNDPRFWSRGTTKARRISCCFHDQLHRRVMEEAFAARSDWAGCLSTITGRRPAVRSRWNRRDLLGRITLLGRGGSQPDAGGALAVVAGLAAVGLVPQQERAETNRRDQAR